MQRLEVFLGDTFGIEPPPDDYSFLSRIRDTCGNRIGEQFEQINEIRATGGSREARRAEKQFYDLISSDPLLGLVHTAKWPSIFDTAAYLTALIRTVGIDGPFIDIGCHAGYHALWLATELGLNGRGVDRSKAAVRYARKKAKRLGLTPTEMSFDSRTISARVPDGGYSLVYSSDGPIGINKESLRTVSTILANDGLFVCVCRSAWEENDAAEIIQDVIGTADMSLLLVDVIGGLDGVEFCATSVFVIARGEAPEVSEDIEAECKTVWESGFSDYCNTGVRRPSEKTLSKYRSWRTYGSNPIVPGGTTPNAGQASGAAHPRD